MNQDNLYIQIARVVASGPSEAYLVIRPNGSFASDERTAALLESAQMPSIYNGDRQKAWSREDIVAAHYNFLPEQTTMSASFGDRVRGVVAVDGAAVEFSVRRLTDDSWRVLFAKTDLAGVFGTISERLAAVERDLVGLKAASSK